MKKKIYQCVTFLSKRIGSWFFVVIAWCIASGYYFIFPKRVLVSADFYQVLFPEKSRFYHLWCSWRQFHSFIYIYLDRWLLQDFDAIRCIHEGWEYVEEVLYNKAGGIFLMSHMGNWEVGAYVLNRRRKENPAIKLLLYLGTKRDEQIEQIQKDGLEKSGIKIIAVEQQGGSPFDIIEGINFLRKGGFVSIAGDLLWSDVQRSVKVRFLGHQALLPEAPFALALLSGAPIMVSFAIRSGTAKYRCITFPPTYITASSRNDRQEAIMQAAQGYADILEKMIRRYPYQWYHFEPFIRPIR